MQAFKTSTREAEAEFEARLGVPGQPRLHREALSRRKKEKRAINLKLIKKLLMMVNFSGNLSQSRIT